MSLVAALCAVAVFAYNALAFGNAHGLHPNSDALSIVLCAAAIEILARQEERSWSQWGAATLAGAALIIAALAPESYAFGTRLSFILLPVAPLLLALSRTRLVNYAHIVCLILMVIALVELTAYGYEPRDFHGPMSLSAALEFLGLICVCCATVLFHVEQGPARILVSPTLGGRIARILMPGSVLIPIGLGWLRLEGQKHHLFSFEDGVAIMAVTTTALLATLIWWLSTRVEAADVTRLISEDEVRKLNASLATHSRQLEDTNRELEAFSYSVSHDLRAPLRSLDGFSRALAEDYGATLDGQALDYLNRIMAAAQRMGRLIDDLLSLARVTRLDMKRVPTNLSAIASAIVDELRESQPDRAAEISIAPDLKVIGDPALLSVALQNLLSNAWKFTAGREIARIEFGTSKTSHERVFYVRDNGAGFDMQYAGKLFGAFQRLHGMTEFAGTGVGLATVQRIITRHGGRVWPEAAPDKGATFYFTIGDIDGTDDLAG